MTLLSESQFKATFSEPMSPADLSIQPSVDFWPYADSIPESDFQGHQLQGSVKNSWIDSSKRFQHVLLDTEDKNTFMVVILDLKTNEISGHHLLDLNTEYGIGT